MRSPTATPAGVLDEFGHDGELVGVGRGHREAGDDTGLADPHVHLKLQKVCLRSVSLPKAASPRKRLHL